MQKEWSVFEGRQKNGFSLIEVLLASALFALIVTFLIGAYLYGQESAVISGERMLAAHLAEEGLEAARNMRDADFANLVDGTHGLARSGGVWTFSGSSDATDAFTRQLVVFPVDAQTKLVTSSVTWQQTGQRQGTLTLTTHLTNWKAPVIPARGGMLVYGDGGTANDAIRYAVLDGATSSWGAPALAADVDATTANKALRAAQVYASKSRNEKILISRHYDGTTQFIYAQVFNGTTWGNVVLLSSWSAGTFLGVHNFSGTYLENGDVMVVYSDNTTTPKFRAWNGASWTAQIALPSVGGIPNYIVARARPGTNEVMAAFFDQSSDTNTAYFNGGAYATASWTLHAQHSGAAPVNTKQMVDFAWSPNNPVKGALVHANAGGDTTLNIKIWTANGAGGGSWSGTVNASAQANQLGAVAVTGRPGANEFIACDKDANASPRIVCYRSDSTPVWTNPANQIVVQPTDTGIQKSYDIGFEGVSGALGLSVYSDTTVVPKLKKYDANAVSWDAGATNLPALSAAVETVRLIPRLDGDDIMILLANTSQDVSSIVWDGANNTVYAAPPGMALTAHGTNGSADADIWFDFAWDRF